MIKYIIFIIIAVIIGVVIASCVLHQATYDYIEQECDKLEGVVVGVHHNASNMPPLYVCRLNNGTTVDIKIEVVKDV